MPLAVQSEDSILMIGKNLTHRRLLKPLGARSVAVVCLAELCESCRRTTQEFLRR